MFKNTAFRRALWACAALSLISPALGETTPAQQAFDESLYTFCDVQLLSQQWKVDEGETKARIGNLLLEGASARDTINTDLDLARADPEGTCAFEDSNYSHADAVDLAVLWELSVADSQRRIGRLLYLGKRKRLDAALAKARAKSAKELTAATAAPAKAQAENAPTPPPTSKAQRQEHLFICLDRHYPAGLPIGTHKIDIRLGVDEFGAVVTADMITTTFTNGEATQCMLDFAKTWHFAVPENGPRTLRIKNFKLEFVSSAS